MRGRAQSSDGRLQKAPETEPDSDEEPPSRKPNTIGDPGIGSPTALNNLRRIWQSILFTRLLLNPYVTVTAEALACGASKPRWGGWGLTPPRTQKYHNPENTQPRKPKDIQQKPEIPQPRTQKYHNPEPRQY